MTDKKLKEAPHTERIKWKERGEEEEYIDSTYECYNYLLDEL